MNYEIRDIDLNDIRRASDNWLRAWLKEDLDPQIHDMVTKELYVREQSTPIGDSDLIINDWLMKKDS